MYSKIALFGKEIKPHIDEKKKSPDRPQTLNQLIKADAATLTQKIDAQTESSVTPIELDNTCMQCTEDAKVLNLK